MMDCKIITGGNSNDETGWFIEPTIILTKILILKLWWKKFLDLF